MTTAIVNELTGMIRSAPSVSSSSTCREALRVMFQHPESKCMVVCNSANEPLGLLMCDRFFLRATGHFDTFYREHVIKFMNRNSLIADVSTPPEALLAEATNRPEAMRNDCIIVTQNGEFAGVAYTADLLRSLH